MIIGLSRTLPALYWVTLCCVSGSRNRVSIRSFVNEQRSKNPALQRRGLEARG